MPSSRQAARRADFELVRDAINGSLNGRCAASSQEYALFLLNIGNLVWCHGLQCHAQRLREICGGALILESLQDRCTLA